MLSFSLINNYASKYCGSPYHKTAKLINADANIAFFSSLN